MPQQQLENRLPDTSTPALPLSSTPEAGGAMPSVDRQASITVVPVEDVAAARAFVDFPYRLYRADPQWVAPLRRDEHRRWSVKHNPTLRSRWVRRFLAYQDGVVVGRVAAIVDEGFARRWEDRTGLFGFFECVAATEAAGMLLRATERVLWRRGVRRIIGPVNLSTHDETGILVRGHDSPPAIMSPYNPPHYAGLLESAGYRRYLDYHSYLAATKGETAPAVRRLARSAAAGHGIAKGITIRPLRLSEWDAEVRTLFELYNASFRDVWGFVPIPWEDFAGRAQSFRPIARPELILVAEANGVPVGFAVTLPDVNQILLGLNGRLLPFGWWQLMRGVPRLRSARMTLLGVRPEYRARGIGVLLGLETRTAAARLGIERLELSLVQATNERVQRVIEAFDCPALKTYRLYERRLRPSEFAA